MAVSSNSIKVASVTVIAMIQGFTADRSALAPGNGREAAIALILMSASMPPLMRQETVRSRRAGLVPGGCPLLNTAIDSDDGNPRLREKARRALGSWLERLRSIIEEGRRRREISGDVDSSELAMLIVSTLEGSLMVSRLQRKDNPRHLACRHLEEYLETNVRAAESKGRAAKS